MQDVVKDKAPVPAGPKATKQAWEKPTLEEVSQRVMAQPYIRFT